jgi:hypothetical protein
MNKKMRNDKELNHLVGRLKRIFPQMELSTPAYLFNNEQDCAPPVTIDWFEFIDKLNKDGLEITDKK